MQTQSSSSLPAQSEVWTVQDMLKWGTTFFSEKGIESPRKNIELLLCEATSMSRLQLYMSFDKPLLESERVRMREFVRRRAKREPLQYIIGKTSFFGLEIHVEKSVLIPRPETEELVERFFEQISKQKKEYFRICDIGTGSGCIALALAKKLTTSCKITAYDVSVEALQTASMNAQRLGFPDISFEKCNILREIPKTTFDCIISNPPYIAHSEIAELDPEVRLFEPITALTDTSDGLDFYRRFATIFPQILEKDGFFALECGFGQTKDIVNLFQQDFDLSVLNDFAGIERFIIGHLKR